MIRNIMLLPIAGAFVFLCAGCGGVTAAPGADTAQSTEAQGDTNMQTAIFAAGCFWGVEQTFRQVDGVAETEVGYTGGHTKSPTYKQVCAGDTGHAEAVRLTYDPEKVSYEDLLDVFWKAHDPTQVNRQGPDVGDQYRSAIFYQGEDQADAARKSKHALEASEKLRRPVATRIEEAGPFYRAEEYHQQYLEKRGLGSCHI